MTAWTPRLGARVTAAGTRFRVWAPDRRRVTVVLEPPAPPSEIPLTREADGCWTVTVPGVAAGARYRYRLDDEGPWPDPASRFQPDGVHGASEVIETTFAWTDQGWLGLPIDGQALYELHVGAFTPDGTFRSAMAMLPQVRDLGVTAVELMPVADFAGARNWGYDGVALFAPSRAYGRPEDLRALVDRAHALGLGVILDVVYNHFGPDGAYQRQFSETWFDPSRRTPWGEAINFSGPGSDAVRAAFVENAQMWIHEYHVDGLRLDATHAYADDGDRPFLADLSAACRRHPRASRPARLFAEDHRNLATLAVPAPRGGWGLDGIWADDLHHELRRATAGDTDGYYADYTGSTADIATTLRRGWFYTGQASAHLGGPRGTDPEPLAYPAFIVCLQNHDQVGNRALGDRLNQSIDPAVFRALTALLLTAPETPLLFMGQEWSAGTPFLFFTDHEPGLGRMVTDGRRDEFRRFHAFADAAARRGIPDPQAEDTFLRSRLDWSERDREPHASQLRLTRALLHLRHTDPRIASPHRDAFGAAAIGDDGLALWHEDAAGRSLITIVRLRGEGALATPDAIRPARDWRIVLSTEDADFAPDARTITLNGNAARPAGWFTRPGAIIIEGLTIGDW
ncbi:MAG: malto-oligosyltrehalose trehalohydrolase [Vicinamibacterales bacterium]